MAVSYGNHGKFQKDYKTVIKVNKMCILFFVKALMILNRARAQYIDAAVCPEKISHYSHDTKQITRESRDKKTI